MMGYLPVEILAIVFGNLQICDLISCCGVCHRWRAVLNQHAKAVLKANSEFLIADESAMELAPNLNVWICNALRSYLVSKYRNRGAVTEPLVGKLGDLSDIRNVRIGLQDWQHGHSTNTINVEVTDGGGDGKLHIHDIRVGILDPAEATYSCVDYDYWFNSKTGTFYWQCADGTVDFVDFGLLLYDIKMIILTSTRVIACVSGESAYETRLVSIRIDTKLPEFDNIVEHTEHFQLFWNHEFLFVLSYPGSEYQLDCYSLPSLGHKNTAYWSAESRFGGSKVFCTNSHVFEYSENVLKAISFDDLFSTDYESRRKHNPWIDLMWYDPAGYTIRCGVCPASRFVHIHDMARPLAVVTLYDLFTGKAVQYRAKLDESTTEPSSYWVIDSEGRVAHLTSKYMTKLFKQSIEIGDVVDISVL